jgi:hypothetical protein
MTMPQPPHLISALEQLDDDQPAALEVVEEAPARRQPGSLVEVFVEGEDPYTVRVTNRDRIAYEKTAARHKEWPAPGERPQFCHDVPGVERGPPRRAHGGHVRPVAGRARGLGTGA